MFDRIARQDFTRARRKAFYQRIFNWFSGKADNLLPYDQVREAIPIRGQHYVGLHPIPIRQIVGSMGRYHEFNRAFLPTQRHTEQRWVNIGRAHYEDVNLPPIEVYKLGDVYFVRDGNHRVSVGRELGKEFIDAFVTEIDIPVSLSRETRLADLEAKSDSAGFLQKTGLLEQFPDAKIEVTLKGEVARLFEHIDTHRYYLGLEKEEEPTYEAAVRSWYTEVYTPLVEEITAQGLQNQFPSLTPADLYLLVSEYQWLLREAYQDQAGLEAAQKSFTSALEKISPEAIQPGKQITRTLQNAPWLDNFIMQQEREAFIQQTGFELKATKPGAYSKILQHIHDHRWFLGIDCNNEVSWQDAVASWHENVYLPMIVMIEELDILASFPGRSETDLYLWIIDHRADLSKELDWDVPADIAARDLVASQAPDRAAAAHSEPREAFRRVLFTNILVPISDNQDDFAALDQALLIAQRNNGRVFGLHVISGQDEAEDFEHERLAVTFNERCAAQGVPGNIAFETGAISRRIAERAGWMDLVVLGLKYPPGGGLLARFSSGFRYVLRRSGKPVLAVPGAPTQLSNILVAYDGSHLADEALYIASGLAAFWEDTKLTVVTAGDRRSPTETRLSRAQDFLESHHLDASYVRTDGPVAEAILTLAATGDCDLIMMGGYGDGLLLDFGIGSTLDGVLQGADIPVLIRT